MIMRKEILKIAKKILLTMDAKFLQTRFFFDVEYLKWKKRKLPIDISYGDRKFKSITEKSIFFLVPGVSISGGIAVVFQHANLLKKRGYNVKLLSLSNVNDSSWFPNQKIEVLPYKETKKILESGEIHTLIATAYSTAFTVAMAKARRKAYFVQSDESRFFPDDPELCKIIKETYELPLEYITEAKWIQKWLKDEYGHEAYYVPNGIDLEVFKKINPIEKKSKKPRILIEGSINVPFKGMDDAYAAVKDIDCELWIVSNNGKPKKNWRYDRFFENVPFGKMNEIYSSCDIFLKMSRVEGFFGPPMEAMACGCAVVVGKVTGYEEYIIDKYNALVVEQNDITGAKNGIIDLINDIKLRNGLIKGGYETVEKWKWEDSTALLEEII